MFEAHINKLRLRRCHASDLDPADFRHMQTIRDLESTLHAYGGWALWASGAGRERIAIAWPWAFIQPGIPTIDPLRIQSNLMLLDGADRLLPEFQALGVLVHVINRLEWGMHAREACGNPYQ